MAMTDIDWMRRAMALADEAAREGEVPVGAIVVKDGVEIGAGRNRRETGRHALAHAEIEAIDAACRALGSWRLSGCELFVTLEPCPMCAGAIINARISRVIYGADDPKAGSCHSLVSLFSLPYNHRPVCEGGVLAEETGAQLRQFFARLREQKKFLPKRNNAAPRGQALW